MECKKLAKENRVSAAKILAKEVVNTRKAMERMQVGITQNYLFVSLLISCRLDRKICEVRNF